MTILTSSTAARPAVAIRMISTASLLALLATALIGAGCSGSTDECSDLCEAANKCPGAVALDCSTFCSEAETVASTAGCTSQYDDFLSCGAAASSVCGDTDPCATQATAFDACTTSYCSAHPTSTACGGDGSGG
jgi:hypothetical protein